MAAPRPTRRAPRELESAGCERGDRRGDREAEGVDHHGQSGGEHERLDDRVLRAPQQCARLQRKDGEPGHVVVQGRCRSLLAVADLSVAGATLELLRDAAYLETLSPTVVTGWKRYPTSLLRNCEHPHGARPVASVGGSARHAGLPPAVRVPAAHGGGRLHAAHLRRRHLQSMAGACSGVRAGCEGGCTGGSHVCGLGRSWRAYMGRLRCQRG